MKIRIQTIIPLVFIKYNKAAAISLVILFGLSACHRKQKPFAEQYYHTKSEIWRNYLRSIGADDPNLNHLVLLVVTSTNCLPCLKELSWWNAKGKEVAHRRIIAIVLSKYETTFKAFVQENLGNITSYRDSSSLILKKKLIPLPPVKLYFNGQSNLVAVNKIGSGGKLYSLVKKIRNN